jgi:hypothetical protein
MKSLLILFLIFFCFLNGYSQKVNVYQDGSMGMENIKSMVKPWGNNFVHTYDSRYEGIKGTPNLFNSLVNSYLMSSGQEKYIQVESDIDILRNTVVFRDPATGILMEIPSDNVKELVFNIYNKDFIYRTTRGLKFKKKIKENKFYQVVREEPYRLIMITFKSFVKADDEPTFNSGRHFDEYRTDRRYFLEDSRGVFHQVIFNNITYDCMIHPSRLSKKELAKIYPEKKEIIYRALEEKPDSITIERILSIIDTF